MMKIEAGKYYRTRDGQKVGPMEPYDGDGFTFRSAGSTYNSQGGYYSFKASEIDLVAEWTDAPDLTAITTPFGLLDEATQAALKAHGGPIERWGAYEGWVICPPLWQAPTVYRVRPAPVEPPKPREWVIHGGLESVIPYVPGVPIPGGYIHVREVL